MHRTDVDRGKMSIRIEVDISDAARAIDHLMEQPSAKAIFGLESVLATTFAETELTVPVDTGSLRGSGKVSSEVTPLRWEGEISYGGGSPGFPHDPVLYAKFVLEGHRIVAWGRQAHRGKQYQPGDDYMAPWDLGEDAFEAAVLEGLGE